MHLVSGEEVLLSLGRVASQGREPPHVCMRNPDMFPVTNGLCASKRFSRGGLSRRGLPEVSEAIG